MPGYKFLKNCRILVLLDLSLQLAPVYAPLVSLKYHFIKLKENHYSILVELLLPENDVCEVTRVCLSMGGIPGQVHPPGRYTPPPWAGTSPPDRYTPATVHAGIRSTSGWYASHWNAFLFSD